MSYADKLFVDACSAVLAHGVYDTGFTVRPKWEDGTPAHTVKIIHVVQIYNLTRTSIPVMTLRKTGFKNAIDEILWIYQKKSNKVSDLHSHVWDSWTDEAGTIGKAYGYQIGQRHRHHRLDPGDVLTDITNEYPSIMVDPDGWVWMDQMDAVLWDLKYNPASRSIMMNMYNHADLAAMGLRPCAYSISFQVVQISSGQLVLNAILNQRSQDTLTANNWNVVQYSVLLQMIAQVRGMIPGTLTHVIADYHIYDRHIPLVEQLIRTYNERGGFPNPIYWQNPDVKNFYDFTLSDFELHDYQYHPFDHKIEVAV